MRRRVHISWHQRIRTRLTIAVTVAIIVPLLTFGLASFRIATSALLEEIQEDLAAAVMHGSHMLTDFVSRVAIDMLSWAYDPDLTGLRASELEVYLSFILRREPSIESISVVRLDGREIGRASRTAVLSEQQLRDLSGSDALVAVGDGRTFLSDPFISPVGEAMMIVAVPLRDQFDRITSMLMASLALRKILQSMAEVTGKAEELGYVYVVDRHGTVIGHPDLSLVLKRVNLAGTEVVPATLSVLPDRTTTMMRYTSALGTDVLGLGTRNKGTGWGVIAEVAAEKALAGLRKVRIVFAIIFASACAIGIAASFYIGTKAGNLIVRIQKAAGAIGEGDFTQRLEVKGGRELEELATDLNLMGEKLKEYHDHMEHDVELLNEQVAQRTQSLQKAYDDLQESDRQLKETHAALVQTEKLAAMGRLVAGVVHEVNNPLTYITNNVEVLRQDVAALVDLIRLYGRAVEAENPSERERLLREAEALGKTLNVEYTLTNLEGVFSRTSEGLDNIRKIVTDLRDFSRIGGAEREPVDLNKAVETTLSIVAYDLRKKQINVETDLADLPPVQAAAVKINQVLLNILLNAIQAVSDKGNIRITTRSEGEWVTVSIRDDGHGIPQEIMPKIFDPFFTTRPPGEGTGLGLSVSYGIVKEHGGTIHATSTPGRGAEFTVRLPVALKQEA